MQIGQSGRTAWLAGTSERAAAAACMHRPPSHSPLPPEPPVALSPVALPPVPPVQQQAGVGRVVRAWAQRGRRQACVPSSSGGCMHRSSCSPLPPSPPVTTPSARAGGVKALQAGVKAGCGGRKIRITSGRLRYLGCRTGWPGMPAGSQAPENTPPAHLSTMRPKRAQRSSERLIAKEKEAFACGVCKALGRNKSRVLVALLRPLV